MKKLIQYPAGKVGVSYAVPQNVERICCSAFSYSRNLVSISIPSSVTQFGDYMDYENFYIFLGCTNLTEISVDSGNMSFVSINGVLFDKNQKTLICYPAGKTETAYQIPAGVEKVVMYAFFGGKALITITVPRSVAIIESLAFAECNLSSITIHDSVTYIGTLVFQSCNNITIYLESASKPNDWHSGWNSVDLLGKWYPVVWGCVLSIDGTYIESFVKSTSSITNPPMSGELSAPYREGYSFGGWLSTVGGVAIYSADDIFEAPDGLLTALWVELT